MKKSWCVGDVQTSQGPRSVSEVLYYGGMVRCDEQIGLAEEYDEKELVCGGCSDVVGRFLRFDESFVMIINSIILIFKKAAFFHIHGSI